MRELSVREGVAGRGSHDVRRRAARAQKLVQITLAHVLKEETHRPPYSANSQKFHNIRVIELCESARLALEISYHVLCGFIFEHLHSDQALLLPDNESCCATLTSAKKTFSASKILLFKSDQKLDIFHPQTHQL